MSDLIPGTRLLPPAAYYEATRHERHYVREVEGPFEDGITHGQRKRIAKCERAGYFFTRATIDEAYPIISENRQRKGRRYGMSLGDWTAMWRSYPDAVRFFAIRPGPVAAAMCVRLTPDVFYVQGWGDVEGQEKYSPVTMICRGIYNWCVDRRVKWLDLGIADEPGLIAFKQSLGFNPR